MNRKMKFTLGAVAAMVLLVASLALAQGRMRGPDWKSGAGMGYCHAPDLTQDQMGKMNKLRAEFYNDTAAVRGQLAAKHAELQALMANPDATAEQLTGKQKEILQLRTQFAEKRITHDAKMRGVLTKEQLTQMAGYGFGCGRGGGYHRGMGMGPGPGPHHGMGMGPGGGPPPPMGMGPGPGEHHMMEMEPGGAPQAQ